MELAFYITFFILAILYHFYGRIAEKKGYKLHSDYEILDEYSPTFRSKKVEIFKLDPNWSPHLLRYPGYNNKEINRIIENCRKDTKVQNEIIFWKKEQQKYSFVYENREIFFNNFKEGEKFTKEELVLLLKKFMPLDSMCEKFILKMEKYDCLNKENGIYIVTFHSLDAYKGRLFFHSNDAYEDRIWS